MRVLTLVLVVSTIVRAETAQPDPAWVSLDKAYSFLAARNYDSAVAFFLKAIDGAPDRASIRKDLAYTYLKIGETDAARDQFAEAIRLDPKDAHLALEYAFLCFETRKQAEARRIFDRVRKTGDAPSRATAEQAFRNIDGPLARGIERWKQALALSPENFSAHHELATLAEQRDELELAAEHYLKAWRLLPERKSVLVDLGRVLRGLKRLDDSNAALLAASRGGEPRAAEDARELLPNRYPYVYEFRHALELDSGNAGLRRELAFLYLRMERNPEAEQEFKIITQTHPEDLLSAAQLGFLYLARNDRSNAMPLLERVLNGADQELANRVRAVLQMPQTSSVEPRSSNSNPQNVSLEAKIMAQRSMQAGYLKDALKYLGIAHESDPLDFSVMLQLGWAYNMLKDDRDALRWFELARQSPDAKISTEAARALKNLRPGLARIRTTVWVFPFYSSRWHDLFSYGQIKTEFKLGNLPLRPYLSARLIGDTRRNLGGALPQYLSESSFILGAGVATRYWHGITAWAEAGEAISYLSKRPGVGRMLPDYRSGVAFARGWGHFIQAEKPGWFLETNADGVFVSRFGNDFLAYSQNRIGFTPRALGGTRFQIFWSGNITGDNKRQPWANFVEFGPGVRFRVPAMPPALMFSANFVRGVYTINQAGLRRPNFYDLRLGFWYAATR